VFLLKIDKKTAMLCFGPRNKTLPLGSAKSVHSFLRVAHSLWAISSVAGSVKFVFKALGWLFAEDAKVDRKHLCKKE